MPFCNYIHKFLKAKYGEHSTPPYNYSFGGTNQDIPYDDLHEKLIGMKNDFEFAQMRNEDLVKVNEWWMKSSNHFKDMADKARIIAANMMKESTENRTMTIPNATSVTKYAAELLDVLDESKDLNREENIV